MNNIEIPPVNDSFEDPLAVKVVGPHGDIPSDGWPTEFKPEVIGRILSYIPEED